MYLDKIKFGPSGTCEDFKNEGYLHTYQVPGWLKSKGLDCFEYSFGRGVMLKPETATVIGKAFSDYDIEISVHAPYFINLATLESDKADNNVRYIFDSLKALKLMGGKRCVFHPGSPLKNPRDQAMNVLLKAFERILQLKEEYGFGDMLLCPETMGKKAQLGNLDEIIAMCAMGDDTIVPCIDWGHLNSRDCGVFYTKDDYKRVIDKLVESIGEKKTKNMHVHFSKIQYSAGGEVRHLTFEDEVYGPPYEPFLEVAHDMGMTPYIVCESAGTQTRDALAMKSYFDGLPDN